MSDGIPSYNEALEMLAERARDGSVTAIVALERALRAVAKEESELDGAIDRILTKAGNGAS